MNTGTLLPVLCPKIGRPELAQIPVPKQRQPTNQCPITLSLRHWLKP